MNLYLSSVARSAKGSPNVKAKATACLHPTWYRININPILFIITPTF